MLGAAGDALRGQTVVARVERVDAEKLKAAIGRYGGAIDVAIDFADWKPKAAVDAAIPFIKKQLGDLGIDATVVAGAAPTRGKSEFWGGLAVGGVLGGGALAIWKLVRRLTGGR
jgi:hypothetical protein